MRRRWYLLVGLAVLFAAPPMIGTGADPTTDETPSGSTADGDSDDSNDAEDTGNEDTVTGLLELSGFGSALSLGAVGITAGILSLVYAYRIGRLGG